MAEEIQDFGDPVLEAIENLADCQGIDELKMEVQDILLNIRRRQNELSQRIFRLYEKQESKVVQFPRKDT